uniref:Uncharacterized protein n=1 Tax=Arundo donax TaxID=35708 RepID=A0A0A9FVQ0_ARUDO
MIFQGRMDILLNDAYLKFSFDY